MAEGVDQHTADSASKKELVKILAKHMTGFEEPEKEAVDSTTAQLESVGESLSRFLISDISSGLDRGRRVDPTVSTAASPSKQVQHSKECKSRSLMT